MALSVSGLLLVAASFVPAGMAERSSPGGVKQGHPWRITALLWLVFAGGCAPGLMIFAHAAPLATARGLHEAAQAGLSPRWRLGTWPDA